MSDIRSPAVAGSFYPADPRQLATMVKSQLDAARSSETPPKALIAPHAGYIYSGPVAASVYARLLNSGNRIERIILIGPSHRVAFTGIATSGADGFETPLGRVRVDTTTVRTLAGHSPVVELPDAHAAEHSLEMQLPFLQVALNDFSIVPLVVGHASATEVAETLDALWGNDETLIVVSSDLSHFLDYSSAVTVDSKTSQAIVELRGEDIGYEQACGRLPIQGLLEIARQRGLQGTIVDQRNSGDTAGARDRVVGYGAYAFN